VVDRVASVRPVDGDDGDRPFSFVVDRSRVGVVVAHAPEEGAGGVNSGVARGNL
jgi:hypothetical protein